MTTNVLKQLNTASWLWVLGILGFCGIHRLYLGKFFSGAVWLFTWGLFGVGQLYDMITLRDQVNRFNTSVIAHQHESLQTYKNISQPKKILCEYCDCEKSTVAQKCLNCGAR